MISCCCPTHGRAHLVCEAVESFRRQSGDIGEVELVLVNDCPEQPITCKVPGVRVVNIATPIPDASLKFRTAVQACNGDLIAWWEDDDISLPWRLAHSLEIMRITKAELYKQDCAWWINRGRNDGLHKNLFFGSAMFKKTLWDRCGGSTPYEWADKTAWGNMGKATDSAFMEIATDETAFFLYMWGGRCQHDSGDGDKHPDALDRFTRFREGVLGDPQFRPGPQEIIPRWNVDYEKLVRT